MAISETWSIDDSTKREYADSMLGTIDSVVEALGGSAKVAELCGVGISAVSNWRKRGRISKGSFLLVRDALAARNLEVSPEVFGFGVIEEARA